MGDNPVTDIQGLDLEMAIASRCPNLAPFAVLIARLIDFPEVMTAFVGGSCANQNLELKPRDIDLFLIFRDDCLKTSLTQYFASLSAQIGNYYQVATPIGWVNDFGYKIGVIAAESVQIDLFCNTTGTFQCSELQAGNILIIDREKDGIPVNKEFDYIYKNKILESSLFEFLDRVSKYPKIQSKISYELTRYEMFGLANRIVDLLSRRNVNTNFYGYIKSLEWDAEILSLFDDTSRLARESSRHEETVELLRVICKRLEHDGFEEYAKLAWDKNHSVLPYDR